MSIVVPFAEDHEAAAKLIERFGRIRLGERDEIVVGDNSRAQVFAGLELPQRWRSVPALGEGSPARARNAGAREAGGDWILFIDSDCVPAPDIVDAYFAEPIPDGRGLVAGRVDALAGQTSLAARYAASRRMIDPRWHVGKGRWSWAFTANLLVRRSLWTELGGFLEGIRNAEDPDFCWRAGGAGWEIGYNPAAAVEHDHRDTFGGLWRQATVAEASAQWLHRRWPEAPPREVRAPLVLARSWAAATFFALTLQFTRALFKFWDGALVLANARAWFTSNRAYPGPPGPPPAGDAVAWVDEYPAPVDVGGAGRVVARRRPDRPDLDAPRVPAIWVEDYTPLERALCAIRHPLVTLRARELAPAAVEVGENPP